MGNLTGYSKAAFSALYQLNLVKAETARAFIPKEFRLVEAFGYTLGSFFLASYDDSPAGIFDELVVIAGIVWNPPTSCAWAARVFVNSDEACTHGRKDVGLPSQVARVRPGSPAKVSRPSELQSGREEYFECQNSESVDAKRNLSISVLLSKPILALQFNCLKMQAESPVVVSHKSQKL